MIVKDWPLAKIIPYDKNPRHNDAAVSAVAKSLEQFGWQQPIVVDKAGVIVVGHTRYRAAGLLGWKTAPVTVADKLTDAQIMAYRLIDNKTAELADWDDELLTQEITKLMEEDFDLSGFGFSEDDLNIMGAVSKDDVRWLENFDVLPKPKPRWILISAPEDACAEIITALNDFNNPDVKFEYSGDSAK